MAHSYRPVLRDQPMLLQEDMRDWLSPKHVLWTVLEIVDQMDTSGFHAKARLGGQGRAGYDPDLLLGLLVYAYCFGQRSTRKIERLCETDVAFRVACANDIPDHTVLARFRRNHQEQFLALFANVLVIAAKQGLVDFDTVAIDGTKIPADASLQANRTEEWVRARAAEILAEAEAVDTAEDELFGDARGDELPDELGDPDRRRAQVDLWLAELKADQARKDEAQTREPWRRRAARRQELLDQGITPSGKPAGSPEDRIQELEKRVEVHRRRQQDKIDAWKARKAAGKAAGREPKPVEDTDEVQRALDRLRAALAAQQQRQHNVGNDPKARVNTTDPESRILPTKSGWVQGYNVQLAVSADQLIIACDVTQGGDSRCFIPMMTAAQQAATTISDRTGDTRQIRLLLADAGYASTANLTAEGPPRLIALEKSYHLAQRAEHTPTSGPPDPNSTAREQMRHLLAAPDGATRYKRRAATVEPAIGNLKKIFNRFSSRGLATAKAETHLSAAAFNILKIHRAATTG